MDLMVADIQRFSLHDGPGIRTTIFLKGCNLKCGWCHNPETINKEPEILFNKNKCIRCGECASVCPNGLPYGGFGTNKSQCLYCWHCVEQCPTGALEKCGQLIDIEDIFLEGCKDQAFFDNTKGGVTVSGGEPLLQGGVIELLTKFHNHGIHTTVDSALNISWDIILKSLPVTSLFLVDIKAVTPSVHKKLTGVDNKMILSNIIKLSKQINNIEIRIPVIPEINIDELPLIAGFIKDLNRNDIKIKLIPFHNFGLSKYQKLGKTYEYEKTHLLTDAELSDYYKLFKF